MRLRANAKGQVLLNVLSTAVVVAIIAAALMRLVLMRATAAAKLESGGQGKVAAQAGYQLLMQDWAAYGSCHNPGGAGGNPFTCSGGGANTCGCKCSGAVAGQTVYVNTCGAPASCNIRSAFNDPGDSSYPACP